jgi:hypothetical protein
MILDSIFAETTRTIRSSHGEVLGGERGTTKVDGGQAR